MRDRAVLSLLDLPSDIGLASLRDLAPMMGKLRQTYQLNVLATEVVAAAIHLDAKVLLSTSSPKLEAALEAEGKECEVSAPSEA